MSFCAISPDEFFQYENCGVIEHKTTLLIDKIIDQHECFSKTYKYIPTKDQNYQSKIKASLHTRKAAMRHKFSNGSDIQQKTITSLLNKLTDSNFPKLIKSIVKLCNSDHDCLAKFAKELFKYAKMSDMHIKLIQNIIKNTSLIQRHRDNFLEVFQDHIDEYKTSVSVSFLEECFQDFDSDEYDDFCRFKKYTKESLNALKTIIAVSKDAEYHVDMFRIFKQQIDNIDQWCRIESKNRHLFIYNAFENVQYILNHTNIKDLIKNDIQQVHLLCIDVLEEFRNAKRLEFKVQEIMKLCEFAEFVH